jgi:light-independent protochlorophyllide reductase subunit B
LGVGATRDFVAEAARLAGIEHKPGATEGELRLPWRSRSVDGACLTGKRVFIFGDATHAIAAARIAADEIGFEVCGLGCCNREFARDLREAAKRHDVEPLITDDCLEVEAAIAAAGPELILGSQMERHIAKRFGIPCATISGPFHVQDHPARHSPQMGWEGANVLFDTWIHPLVMGLEEHLLAMVREDREFRDAAGPSHPGAHRPALPHAARAPTIATTMTTSPAGVGEETATGAQIAGQDATWTEPAERELRKIPSFIRGKARRNTEACAASRGVAPITIETLCEAKAHHAR